MPEIKHQFTGGKMNKDVDERLVPNGEYRDAMNIQVSTSEQSEVGTVQNILGNIKINSCTIPELEEHCVASIADEKYDTGYYFIASSNTQEVPYLLKRDMIVKFDGTKTTPVFVDPYHKTCTGQLVYPTTLNNANNPSNNYKYVIFDFTGDGNPNFIEPGDVITRIIFNLIGVQEDLNIKIVSVDNASSTFTVLLRDIPENVRPNLDGGEVIFTIGGENHRVLNFDKDRLITGINVIDDMLFWTDGVTEPKKINIERSIKGTDGNCLLKTKLIIDNDFVQTSYHNHGGEPVLANAPCKEEHITVIKKSPSTVLWTSVKDATELTTGYVGQPDSNGIAELQPFNDDFSSANPTILVVGDEERVRLTVNNSLDINAGDIIVFNSTSLLLPSIGSYQCKAEVVSLGQYYLVNKQVNIKILAIDSDFDLDDTYNWAEISESEEDPDTFKNKLPRFSYRYKYEDGEYSCFAPFTNIVFSPGTFGYEPKEAYNLGMENTIRTVAIKGYKNNIPLGVVQIDLLYKESNSPAIYLIDSIKPNKTGIGPKHWEDYEAGYTVKPNLIRAILPSNQLLRPFDNVPRSALSQEITANRLVYANYLQNYNIDFNPLLNVNLKTNSTTNISSLKARSLKSMRNYTLGISYLDEFNRQSPVFSSEQSNITIPIASSQNLNSVTIQPFTEAPHWATHYKVFVKDTSNEYYNLSMDRVYEAQDDNVWLSFPSSDRNKVTDETFLILKKDVLSSTPITVKNRYKILAIENEAPDFIKTRNPLVSRSAGAVHDLLPEPEYIPRKDSNRIKIDWALWNQEEIALEDVEKPLTIRFSTISSTSEPVFSQFYDIASFSVKDNSNPANPPDFYDIKLSRTIKESWLTQQNFPPGSQNTEDILEPSLRILLHRKLIENRPEFDGRFFVKISKDPLIESNVLTQIAAGLQSELTGGAILPFYFLADGDSGFTENTGNSASNTRGMWSNLVKFGGNSKKGRWFIDATYHAGGYNEDAKYSAADPVAVTTSMYNEFSDYCDGCGGKEYLRTEGMLRLNDAPNMIGYPNWDHYPIADRNTNGFGKGIYEDDGKYYIDLAFTKIGRDLENPSQGTHFEDPGDGPNTGSQLGSNTETFTFSNIGTYGCGPNSSNQLNWAFKTCGSWVGLDSNGNSTGTIRGELYGSLQNIIYCNLDEQEWIEPEPGNGALNVGYNWGRHPDIGSDEEYAGCNPNFSWYNHLTLDGGTGETQALRRDFMCELADVENSPFYGNDDNLDPWTLGSYKNQIDEGEKEIVQNLVEGNKFRFVNDTNDVDVIYTIKDVETKYYVNYANTAYVQEKYNEWATQTCGDIAGKLTTGAYRSPRIGCNSRDVTGLNVGCGEQYMDHVLLAMEDMAQDYNRKIVYKIEIDKNPLDGSAWDPIDPNNVNEGAATNNSLGQIQFLTTQSIQDDEGLQSDNPAMWETEQNSDNDLDIYYEIDDGFPLQINSDTNYDFAPIGSTFTPNNNIEKGINKYTVVEWNENHCKLDRSIKTEHENAWYNDIANLTKIKFLRPNGTTVRARFLGLANPISIGGNHGESKWITLDKDVSQYPIDLSWYNCYSFGNGVESDRIRDDFNQIRIDKGAKASSTIEEPYQEEHRKYGLIYSGLYNSNSGVNNLNQFIQAEKITKDINPTYGSIQKLHARDTDLVTLCEDKCLRIMSNKDAVFNADGNTNLTATNKVLGQTVPFSGEFGISTNPESFASEAYRSYFTDKVRGVVLRLSKDGLTPISMYGMKDWFKDNLKLSNKLIGSYDDKKDEYNVSLKGDNISKTVTFREDVKGWVSFKSFVYENAVSVANEYYTLYNGELFKHHVESTDRNTFYNGQVEKPFTSSSVNVILNDQPGIVKSFNTLNYEGSQTKIDIFETKTTDDFGNTIPPTTDQQYFNLEPKKGWYVESIETDKEKGSLNEFIEKEGKWFNYLKGKSVVTDIFNKLVDNEDGSSTFDQASFAIQGIGTATTQSVPPTESWDCYGPDNCVDPGTGQGLYSTLASCEAACTGTVIFGCMDCGYLWEQDTLLNPTSFFCPGNTTGTFSNNAGAQNFTLAATEDDGSCTYPAVTYNCVNNVCTDPGTGNGVYTTLNDCLNDGCQSQQPRASWDCTLTGCVDPGTGNGQYTSLSVCQAACSIGIDPCIPVQASLNANIITTSTYSTGTGTAEVVFVNPAGILPPGSSVAYNFYEGTTALIDPYTGTSSGTSINPSGWGIFGEAKIEELAAGDYHVSVDTGDGCYRHFDFTITNR